MTYWAFDEFAADLDKAAEGLRVAYENVWLLLPPDPAWETSRGLGLAYYHLRVAAWEFRMITEWARGISPDGDGGLTWPEIAREIDARWSLTFHLDFFSFQLLDHTLKLWQIQEQIGQIALLDRPDLSAELAALTEHVKILHKTVGVLLLGEEVEKVAEGKPWTFWLKPWNWLGGFAGDFLEFVEDVLVKAGETTIDAGERILDHLWGVEYSHWGEEGAP
uniref:Uncharacterized protein n=1 Tax=viral metagenome TaxID=1070528 RepID=A0A6H1ZZ63_9ZZZZ